MSTYQPIASITLASAAAEVTFSGIPQTYTDLIIAGNGIKSGDHGIDIQFNNDTGSNYSVTFLYGDGTSAVSGRGSNQTAASGGRLATNGAVSLFHIMNYANTTTNKTMLSRGSNAAAITIATVSLWRSTAAINSIKMSPGGGGDFASGSTFNLYGIANASITNVAKATGGDSVYTDGTYWYHIFRSSGTFTPTQALTADYLVVAGGGGGGAITGGGGGAGGLRCTVGSTGGGGSLESALSLTAQAYTVTIGAGAAGGSVSTVNGSNGSNSVFASITATGGGAGGSNDTNGSAGGAGGGGGGSGVASKTGGAGTANQGFAGGNNFVQPGAGPCGGGGGAGAVGSNGASSVAGAGGAGVTTSISGTSTTYAGGGGGGIINNTAGAGGSGGGGAGSTTATGTAGTANTGGGGGGAGGGSGTGGAGGSGIVVIRYSAA